MYRTINGYLIIFNKLPFSVSISVNKVFGFGWGSGLSSLSNKQKKEPKISNIGCNLLNIFMCFSAVAEARCSLLCVCEFIL